MSKVTTPTEYDKKFKIVITGSYGVGKTSIMMRFSDDDYNVGHSEPTIGIDY